MPPAIAGQPLPDSSDPLGFLDESGQPSPPIARPRASNNPLDFLGDTGRANQTSARKPRYGIGSTPLAKTTMAGLGSLPTGVKVGGGCLLAFLVFAVLGGLLASLRSTQNGSATAIISGNTAKWTTKIGYFLLSSDPSSEVNGMDLAEDVYGFAVKHPSVRTLEITLMVEPEGGLTDHYGHQVSHDIELGVVTVDDLDDVRKFADVSSYQFSPSVKASFAVQIERLRRFSQLPHD